MTYNNNVGGIITESQRSFQTKPSSRSSNNFRSDLSFSASPIHRQRILNAQSQNSSTRSKRVNSDSDEYNKKVKDDRFTNFNSGNIPTEKLTLENINLEEYAKFNHPDGGIIQFTPIGNIRTFINDANIVQRVIEHNSTFDLAQTDRGIDGYKIFLGNSHDHGHGHGHGCHDCSPSKETESYMRSGYENSYYVNPSSCMNFDYDCDSDLDDDEDFDMN
ncbi:hypothetical protein DAMA08_032140 [Martiniozyma asiatica (nom. inval.)]|nr:hypothetical protein DAMA08_032140 [Martiniozyma asiatica]